jgi:hypothetical protein
MTISDLTRFLINLSKRTTGKRINFVFVIDDANKILGLAG